MIVYAITSHDIHTNDMLMVQQLNNNKHTAGLNADLLKVKIFEDFFFPRIEGGTAEVFGAPPLA